MRLNPRGIASRLASFAAGLIVLWLIAFHAILLWRRLADATISDPGVLYRWIGAAILLAAALRLRSLARRFSSRSVHTSFWLLVALLHIAVPGGETILDGTMPLATLVQYGVAAAPALLWALARLISAIAAIEIPSWPDAPAGLVPLLPVAVARRSPRAPPIR